MNLLGSIRLLTIVGLAACVPGVFAQDYNGHVYGHVGNGLATETEREQIVVGGGGEGFVWKGLAAGGDINYVFRRDNAGEGQYGLGSVGAAYHFTDRTRQQKLVPFVTGGYSLGFAGGGATINLFHYGGGVTYWMAERVGLRVEFRDHVESNGRLVAFVRVGVSFR